MNYSAWLEFVKNKLENTDLEKDILDTWHELMKAPFDRVSAEIQVKKNNAAHPDIHAVIAGLSTTVMRPYSEATDADIQYNLKHQLNALIVKEAEKVNLS